MSSHRFICVNSHVHVHSINQEMYMERISVKPPHFFPTFFWKRVAKLGVWLICMCDISPSVYSVILTTITFRFFHVISLPANHDFHMCQKNVSTNVQSCSLGFVLHAVYMYNAILLLWNWTKTNCELVIRVQVCSPGRTWNHSTDVWLFTISSHL